MVRLPAEYQEVEYLESTGTEYIDTGYYPNDTTKVVCDFRSPTANNNPLFGCRDGASVGALDFDAIIYDTSRYGLITRFNSQTQNTHGFVINKRCSLSIESGRFVLDDTVFSTYNPTTFQCTQKSLTIFARNLNSGILIGSVRIYYFKIWDDGVLARNLIPCYRKSDNEPGMYDTVSKTFYTNSGTGTFLVGGDVSWDTASLLSRRRQILLNTPHIKIASGAMASFNTDISANLKECKVYFSPVQEGTGDPSPDNVRPITGWDGVTVSHSISDDIYVYNVTSVGNTYLTKINNNSFRLYTKAKVEYPSSKQLSTSLGFVSGKKYRIEFDISVATLSEGHHINFGFRNNGNTFQTGYLVRCDTDGHYAFEFTFTNTTNLNYLSLCQVVSGTGYFDATISNLKIYEIESLTIPFPQTIYGGYVDLVKGEIVEEWVKTAFNVGRWVSANGVISCFAREVSGRKTQVSGADVESKIICNIYKTHRVMPISQVGNMPDLSIAERGTYNNILVRDTRYETIEDYIENMPDGEFAYVLTTPNTYTLTPEIIKTLKGVNNIWSNANGNVEVSYYSH